MEPNVMSGRLARFNLKLPLSFKADDEVVSGSSVNVSGSGMLATFDKPVELWITGELSLTVGDFFLELQARVARLESDAYGLSFLIRNENDEAAVRLLIGYAASGVQSSEMR